MSITNNDEDMLITTEKAEASDADTEQSKQESKVEKENTKDSKILIKNNNYPNYLIAFIVVVIVGVIVYLVNTSNNISDVIGSIFLNPRDLILIILSFAILISFFIDFWRGLAGAGNEIVAPETLERDINSLNELTNEGSSIIQRELADQTAALNNSSKVSDKTNEEISRISEVITYLQNSLEKKEEEMERYKKGYDADIYHNFLLSFTKVDQVIKEYIDDGKIDLEGLDDIHIEMEDALLECGVESFSPEIGLHYKTIDNIADNPKRIPTNDKNQHEKVAAVSHYGYLRKCEDSSVEIISQARVIIYEYTEQ